MTVTDHKWLVQAAAVSTRWTYEQAFVAQERLARRLTQIAPDTFPDWSHLGTDEPLSEGGVLTKINETRSSGIVYRAGHPAHDDPPRWVLLWSPPGIPDPADGQTAEMKVKAHPAWDDTAANRDLKLEFTSDAQLFERVVPAIVEEFAPDTVTVNTRESQRGHKRTGFHRRGVWAYAGYATWLRGVTPEQLDGLPVRDVRTLGDGTLFWTTSEEPDAPTQLNQQLTARGLIRSLIDVPAAPAATPRPTARIPSHNTDAEFQSWITGVTAPPGEAAPVYRAPHPDGGEPISFHGHLWRDTPDGRREVFLTAMGGFGPALRNADPHARDAILTEWVQRARRQTETIPADALNEWHFDSEPAARATLDAFQNAGLPTRVYSHDRAKAAHYQDR